MPQLTQAQQVNKISTGIDGLDEITNGGLIADRAYLVQGGPGSGKSTVGFHFLEEAVKKDQETLYITLGESKESIMTNASNMGIDLSHVHFLDLSPGDDLESNFTSYSVFSPSEVEQDSFMTPIINKVEEVKPTRVVLDSVTMLRFMNEDRFQMRKTALSFIKFVCNRNATLMMISESSADSTDEDATFWVDGIIKLDNSSIWRKISISKFRGSDFVSGKHTFKITGEGIKVFPKLQPHNYDADFERDQLSSGVAGIDQLLHGGIEKGTTTLIVGPTGVGKTNLGIQFMKEAASQNQRSIIYTFEESKELITSRSEAISIPVSSMLETRHLEIKAWEPFSHSADEFAEIVRTDVEQNGTEIVMIDSAGGYGLAVREQNTLEHLHALSVYLQNMGVTTYLLIESPNVSGDFTTTNMNASYLADNILFLRYLEQKGKLNKAIGVLKKRLSDFENAIRSFQITTEGIKVGDPLVNLRGILSGIPEHIN